MFWRKFKMDWTYAIGELFIVTIGVLIALAFGEWNSERLERAEEFDVLSRLISDIEMDVEGFGTRLMFIDRKEESLFRVKSALSNGGPPNTTEFLHDIIKGADFGWMQGSVNRMTFDDLLGSKGLAIISDTEVRVLIAAYYKDYSHELVRTDEHETEYPYISYQLVPRSIELTQTGHPDESFLESGLSNAEIKEIIKAVQESSIRDHLTAEINLARLFRGITNGYRGRAVDLIARLKEYQSEIR